MTRMNRWIVAIAGVGLVGCAAPDPVPGGGDSGGGGLPAEIRILYPPSGGEIELTDDGHFQTLVVIDTINFDYVVPNTKTDPVEGEGHYHLFVADEDYVAPTATFFEVDMADFPPDSGEGDVTSIRVTLQQNDHNSYEDVDPNCICEDNSEFTVVPSGGADLKATSEKPKDRFRRLIEEGEIPWRPEYEAVLDAP